MRREQVRPLLRVPDELVHDVRRLAPVRINDHHVQRHLRPVVPLQLHREEHIDQGLQSRVELTLESCGLVQILERRPRLGEREVFPLLIRKGSIVHDPAAEIRLPGRDDIVQESLLDIDERGQTLRLQRDLSPLESVCPGNHLLGLEHLGRLVVLDLERLVLVFSEEGHLVPEAEVPGVLDRRQLVVVEPLLPADAGSRVHLLPVLPVELGRLLRMSGAEAVVPHLRVLPPQLLVLRPVVDQLHPLPVPLWMDVSIQDPLGHVSRLDNGTGHDPANLLTRASQSQDSPGEDRLPRRTLRRRPG